MTGILARLAGIACLLLVVGGCTGTDSSFGIGKKKDPAEAAASAEFPNVDGASGTAVQPTAGTEVAAVYFAPIVGAPVEMVAALSKRLGPVAGANGLRLVPAGTPATTHEIKGYFSAFAENGSITVIHVWDVVVPSGQRVHRIQGQETVPGGSVGDPWASVTPATMETIADKVIGQYLTWLKSGA